MSRTLPKLKQVLDKDIGQDKQLGIAKVPLIDLEADNLKEVHLRLLPSLDTTKIKDKKDRGTVTIKVDFYSHPLSNVILDLVML